MIFCQTWGTFSNPFTTQFVHLIILKLNIMSKEKEPKKSSKKAPVKNLKEKRAEKAAKRNEKNSTSKVG